VKSIYRFAKEHGLPRSTVHAKAQALNINTANGLDEASQHRLLIEFRKNEITEAPGAMVLRSPSSICPDVVDPGEIVLELEGDGQAAYNRYMNGVTAVSQKRVAQLQNFASAYAQNAFAQVFADIDTTAATLRANALNSVQLGVKPLSEE
jgi:hypothetical protein